MEKIVISIGGSIFLSEKIKKTYFDQLNELLQIYSKEYRFFLVVGGGQTARFYIKKGRKLGFNEADLDQLGIDITRVNAKMLGMIIDKSNSVIPKSIDEAIKSEANIVIMGGTTPGHSTDMVGAELAARVNACKFIIATDVDGIFDKDPKKFSDAKKFRDISIKDLIKKYGTAWDKAGKNMVIDGPALKIIQQSRVLTFVLNGSKILQLEKVILNKDFNGTVIK